MPAFQVGNTAVCLACTLQPGLARFLREGTCALANAAPLMTLRTASTPEADSMHYNGT